MIGLLRKTFHSLEPHFQKGGRLEKLYPLFEATDSFLFTPGKRTASAPFVRDALDIKRVMVTVIVALTPALLFGIYNAGYEQIALKGGPVDPVQAFLRGAWIVMPIIMVSYAVGGFWEVLFACVRKHEINEGFLVTGMLFALTLPPHIPLWQVAVGISFGVVIGKEIFGGTGYNVFNPALVGRAFLFFAYPGQMSGDAVWVAVDGVTQATPLSVLTAAPAGADAVAALQQHGYTWTRAFFGFIPGSIGETSKFACLAGFVFLLVTGVASWRITLGAVLGLLGMASVFTLFRGAEHLAYFSLPPYWHLLLGGFCFGAVFMATDPVSAPGTNTGRWIYGLLIGVLVVLIRVVNPAYPEGVMLAILLMNAFAPVIDHFVVEQHMALRMKRKICR